MGERLVYIYIYINIIYMLISAYQNLDHENHNMGERGGAPEICARYLRCCCEHLLCAKGSHDASVRVQARV